MHEQPRIEITTLHAASSHGIPVCLINGELVDQKEGIRQCLARLGWQQQELARRCGLTLQYVRRFTSGATPQPAPANLWNVLKDALTMLELDNCLQNKELKNWLRGEK